VLTVGVGILSKALDLLIKVTNRRFAENPGEKF